MDKAAREKARELCGRFSAGPWAILNYVEAAPYPNYHQAIAVSAVIDANKSIVDEHSVRELAVAASTLLPQTLDALDAADSDTARLQEVIAGLYQVIGALADHTGLFDDPNVTRALDVAAYGKASDGIDLLPWPHTPLPTIDVGALQARVSELEAALSRGVDSVMIGTAGEAYARVNSSGANIGAIRAALEAVFPAPPVGDR